MLTGLVPPDDAAQKVTGCDASHHVVGLPAAGGEDAGGGARGSGGEDGRGGEDGGAAAPVTLSWALGRLRALGARGFRLALPIPGHPLGLSGPAEFNERAMEAGEAVLTVGGGPLGLVPELTTHGPDGDRVVSVLWRCLPVRDAPPADVPTLAEAERELNEALREATAALDEMDVAGSGPEALAALEAYRARRTRAVLAPGYPPRAVRVLELAQRVGALMAIAGVGHGGEAEHGSAVSASQMAARAAVLRPVERTARRAQVAAYNAWLERQGAEGPQ